MLNENAHLTDQELLSAADGELPGRRADQVRAHLASCWDCRARMTEIEGIVADFVRIHRQTLDPKLPPIAGPRAQLRAQVSELAAQHHRAVPSWRRFFQLTPAARAAGYLCLAVLVSAAGGKLLFRHFALQGRNSVVMSFAREAVPNRSLTPGATRQVAVSDVCSMAHEEVVQPVPTPLRQEVFQEYGIATAHANDYEVDYLITPGLGGAQDIHNLWPEPYSTPTWNAHVKDALEEHLHQLVCSGKLDLSAAQRDISTDWIVAYKKYFHTDKPLSPRAEQIGLLGVS